MRTATLTNTDLRIQDAVLRQLDWDPQVIADAVGVTAKDHTVTLTGYIDTYAGKLAAERAAKRVRGVRAVANDIEVRLMLARTDTDIATDAARALELRASTIPDAVQAAVHGGHVTLTGKVDWLFQKRQAEKAVDHIAGVRGVMNHIKVVSRGGERDLRRRIVQAMHENADVDARHVKVTVAGERATLTGTVRTWLQRKAVEDAVGDAPGVTEVDNRLLVEAPELEPTAVEPPDEMC